MVFPGLTLDLGAYAQWVGSMIGWAVGTLQNVLTSLYDVAADLVVPCPATLGGTFGDFTGTFRGGPFGAIGGAADAVKGAVAGGSSVPFTSFAVMGHTVVLPIATIAADAAPIRPYLVPIVWFAVALRALGMVAATMKAPGPTGWLADSKAGM